MKKIGIVYCERIQDASCVGCAKCYKSVNENTFAFEDAGEVRVVFKCGCGDCPGLVVPRVDLQMTVLDALGCDGRRDLLRHLRQEGDMLMNCPMNVEGVTRVMEEKFGVPVHMGTHDY